MDIWLSEDENQYQLIDDALRTYPQQPAPADLLPEVMQRIQMLDIQKQKSAAWYNPRKGWVYALGFSILTALVLVRRFGSLLPLDWTARAQFRLLVWQHNLSFLLPQYGLGVGLWMMFTGLVLLAGIVGWRLAGMMRWRSAS